MNKTFVLVSFLQLICFSLSSPIGAPGKPDDAWSKRVQDRLSVIDSELLAIAKLVDGNDTSILVRKPRQADDEEDDEEEFEEGIEYEDGVIADRISEDEDDDDDDGEDDDYIEEDIVVVGGGTNRAIEVDEDDEDYEDDDEFETSALLAERSLRSKNPKRIVDDDEGNSVEVPVESTDVAEKKVGESHSSSVSKIKRKRKGKKRKQVGLSTKRRRRKNKSKSKSKSKKSKKTKSKKSKKTKKSKKGKKKKKRKQTGLSAGNEGLTENQISTLCENQRIKKGGISETTTLRQTETSQDLAAQVAKLAEAFKLLQEAITKARGSDLGSISVPTSVPSSGGPGATLKEAEKVVETPVPVPANASSETQKEPVPAEASGIDSLVKAAIGVQGQAANALKGMLPGGR